jgi:hypothetical protein
MLVKKNKQNFDVARAGVGVPMPALMMFRSVEIR